MLSQSSFCIYHVEYTPPYTLERYVGCAIDFSFARAASFPDSLYVLATVTLINIARVSNDLIAN